MTATATLTDLYGLPLSTNSTRAAATYRDGQQATLAQAPGPGEQFSSAIAADPEFALAHAALALIQLRELRLPEARSSAATAERLAARATRREQQHIAAVADAVGGRGFQAIARIREHLREFPHDALLLNHVTTSLLFAGQQDRMVQVSEAAGPAYGEDDWFWLGIHAFALQEVRRFAEARRAALRSLD
ncbi:MAG TPA: tetratricopeptide repeat protein, partial [Dehalococcoidia bacterium]